MSDISYSFLLHGLDHEWEELGLFLHGDVNFVIGLDGYTPLSEIWESWCDRFFDLWCRCDALGKSIEDVCSDCDDARQQLVVIRD